MPIAMEALEDQLYTGEVPEPATVHGPVPRPVNIEDAALLDIARQAKNGAKFTALYDRGDVGAHSGSDASQSGADQTLANLLAFWTGCDDARMDRLFRGSALMRDKWDAKARAEDASYGAGTIRRAIEQCTDTYTPSAPVIMDHSARPATGAASERPVAPTITALSVSEWLATADTDTADIVIGDGADGFVLSIDGKLAIAGPTGIGKSNILLRLGRSLAEGVPFLNLPIPQRRRVLHIALEGSRRGLRKRLTKVWDGADQDALDRYHLAYAQVNVMRDGAAIDELLNHYRPEVLILDPLRNAHTFDENDSQQIAELTNTLDGIISRHGCALIFAHHHRKSQGFVKDEGIDAVRGSTAFTGWLSAVLIVKPRPKETDVLLADWVKVRDSEVALPAMELEFLRASIDFRATTRREDVNLEDAITDAVFQNVTLMKKKLVPMVAAATKIGQRKVTSCALAMVEAGKLEVFVAPEDKKTGAHSYRLRTSQQPQFSVGDEDE